MVHNVVVSLYSSHGNHQGHLLTMNADSARLVSDWLKQNAGVMWTKGQFCHTSLETQIYAVDCITRCWHKEAVLKLRHLRILTIAV